jgi:flavin reductase (DIM6/NTAB) family NADH-FMN oxidoreductase RutF
MNPEAKKTVLRMVTYGLYAVTARHGADRGVFTANWLSQASFEPPLVMLSVELDSSTLPIIRQSGRFTICPLANDQRDLAGDLGRPKRRAGDKFETLRLDVTETDSGDLAIANTLGYLVCNVQWEMPAGDSVVLLGEVVDAVILNDANPLTMREAGFRHAG